MATLHLSCGNLRSMAGEHRYELHVHGISIPHLSEIPELTVESFEGFERMSACYHYDIEVLAEPSHNLGEALLGQRATFRQHVPAFRVVHGLLSAVELVDIRSLGGQQLARYRVRLVPRLWLLTKKKRSRVFQNKSVVEVVAEVLRHNRVPAAWAVHHRYPRRAYCVQLEETDEQFVRRLMAEAGIFFFFLQPDSPLPEQAGAALEVVQEVVTHVAGTPSYSGEVLVFADEAVAYHGIGAMPPGLQALLQAGLAQLDQVTGGVLGEVAQVAGEVNDRVSQLGGPDLRQAMGGSSRALHFVPDQQALLERHSDVVRSFAFRSGVKSNAALFRTYDPRRPLAALEHAEPGHGPAGRIADALGIDVPDAALETAGQVAGVAAELGGAIGEAGHLLGTAVGHAELQVYDHHGHWLLPDWPDARHEPKRMLRGQLADRWLGRGTSITPLLTCGGRFTLSDHPLDWINREYAVVEVRHHGRRSTDTHAGEMLYDNEFLCVPANVPFTPPRPPRRNVQSCLTATVIAAGSDAEIATHTMAEIKVRFHWERDFRGHSSHDAPHASRGHAEAQSTQHTWPDYGSCWVRTMHPWAGTGWGCQFMPRVGMEVVVGFDGGDPDKPIVLGCLYNATHPAPFPLPQQQTMSGIRTNSTGDGNGFNELSFEDRDEHERVYLHAQRDLEFKVKNDRRSVVDRDDFTTIEHNQRLTVRGEQRIRLEGNQHIEAQQDRSVRVEGRHELVTQGEHHSQVRGDLRINVGGSVSQQVRGSHSASIGGDGFRRISGSVTELVQTSRTIHVNGPSKLHSSGPADLTSDAQVMLQAGGSSIIVSNDCIELSAPKLVLRGEGVTVTLSASDLSILADGRFQAISNNALIRGSGAGIALSSEASIDGSQVLLNSPSSASDSVEQDEQTPTVIELKDQHGNPVPRARYRIEFDDGATTGMLDDDGRAEIIIEGNAQITFPDFGEVTQA